MAEENPGIDETSTGTDLYRIAYDAYQKHSDLHHAPIAAVYEIGSFEGTRSAGDRLQIMAPNPRLARLGFDPQKLAVGILAGDLENDRATIYYAHEGPARKIRLPGTDFDTNIPGRI